MYEQHEQAIKHLSHAAAILEDMEKRDRYNGHVAGAAEDTTRALTAMLMSRSYQYDFNPLTEAMKAWR